MTDKMICAFRPIILTMENKFTKLGKNFPNSQDRLTPVHTSNWRIYFEFSIFRCLDPLQQFSILRGEIATIRFGVMQSYFDNYLVALVSLFLAPLRVFSVVSFWPFFHGFSV